VIKSPPSSPPQPDPAWERRAASFVVTLMTEPDTDSVERLAALGDGDADHARWELRYLRRALGLLIAGRDSLDDRTASLVGQALARAVAHDACAAPAMRATSAAQFNARLRRYRDVMGQRGGSRTPLAPLGEVLVAYAGGGPDCDAESWAAAWIAAELDRCNEGLRQEFGTADLPADIAPSAMQSPSR